MTNGLGIVRDISFYNKDFLEAHPDIIAGKKSDSPDEDKSLADSKALIPTLKDFFRKHPLLPSKPIPSNETGRKQIPSPLWTANHEVCMPQNEMGI